MGHHRYALIHYLLNVSGDVISRALTLAQLIVCRPLASSMFAPGVPLVMQEFETNSEMLATFVVSVFVLGFAFGPLLLAPLSELYGRTIVYHVCNVLFVVFTVMCAVATNMGMLIAARFLAGFAGVAVITCGGGSIADVFPAERRGGAMAIWSLGPLLGPVIGPVAGGFLVEAKGWRWVFWIITIVVSFFSLQCHRDDC
jgi:multidrug resistance protein